MRSHSFRVGFFASQKGVYRDQSVGHHFWFARQSGAIGTITGGVELLTKPLIPTFEERA